MVDEMMQVDQAGATGTGTLPEIEGVRALAVLAVLLYHASFGFSGGYVGVDVFFVVSGFLITSLLIREHRTHGRVSLANFYARRIRRLLPAAVLVLGAVLLMARLLLTTSRLHRTASDVVWSGGFLANVRFASQGTSYLHATDAASLVQHWWSLAVEEQFYLIWPGLLASVWWIRRRFGRVSGTVRSSASVAVPALILCAVGVTLGVLMTRTNPSWAYFATWTRGWELAAGALCAVVWTLREQVPWRGLAGWLGLGLVFLAALSFDERTAFPGVAVLVPVLGTMLLIFSIGGARGPGRWLSIRPLQWIGGRSYALYLWHWPLLMVLADRVAVPSPWWRLAMLVLAVVLAAASLRLVENPIRHHRGLVGSSQRSLVLGGVLTAAALVMGTVTAATSTYSTSRTGYVAPVLATQLPTTTVDSGTSPSTLPSESTSPTTTLPVAPADELARLVSEVIQPSVRLALGNDLVPDNLTPTLDKVRRDEPSIYTNGCLQMWKGTSSPPCEFGDLSSSVEIALFGDSHAAQWYPALERAALEHHWKIIAVTKAGCPPLDLNVRLVEGTAYPACDLWRANTIRRIAASPTQLVIMSTFKYVGSTMPISTRGWRMGLERTVEKFLLAGKKILLLADTPTPLKMPADCVAAHTRSLSACALNRATHTRSIEVRTMADVAARYGIRFYDPSDWFCTDRCPLVIGNVMVYRDPNHVSATFSTTLAPYLALLVQDALASSPVKLTS